MKKLVLILLICLFSGFGCQPNSSTEHSIWIKVVDQFSRAISGADVFYCQDEACRHLINKPPSLHQTTTNYFGYAELKIGSTKRIHIQGIKKEGYDIRFDSLPFHEIILRGKYSITGKYQGLRMYQGITVKYKHKIEPYSLPIFRPIFVLSGYKLGPPTCLEQDQRFILHSGSAEASWDIKDAEYYYQLGNKDNVLRDADADNYDFKITVNRSGYPWSGLVNRLLSSYRLDFEFPQGGAQLIDPEDYIHLAPRFGYAKKLSIKYRGIGGVSISHKKKIFVKIGGRYGVINLYITPSQRFFFEYLISREKNQRQLNFPSYVGERGRTMNYFSCVHSAPVKKARRTLPGACAELAWIHEYEAC